METSLLLYLKPEWLLPLQEAGSGAAKKFTFHAMREGWAWAERKWTQVTTDTGVGDPRKATREKGEACFKAVTEKVATFFFEVARTRPNDFYVQ